MSQPKPAQPVRICLQNRSHSGVIKHFSAQAGVQFQLHGFFQALRWQPECWQWPWCCHEQDPPFATCPCQVCWHFCRGGDSIAPFCQNSPIFGNTLRWFMQIWTFRKKLVERQLYAQVCLLIGKGKATLTKRVMTNLFTKITGDQHSASDRAWRFFLHPQIFFLRGYCVLFLGFIFL